MALSRRRATEASTLTITSAACSVSRKPGAVQYNVVARQSGLDVSARAELLNHTDSRTLAQYDHTIAGETAAARESVRAALKSYVGDATPVAPERP